MYLQLLYITTLRWMKEHLLSCPFKKYLHIDCPGCGFQRSFIALLEGDLHTSLLFYPATIPILMMIIFTALHLKFNYFYGAALIKYLQLIIAIIIVAFYIYKIIHLKIVT